MYDMKVLSMDLRQRIVSACDRGDQTQQQIADRFEVSLGMVKKLLKQRRKTGDIAPRYHLCKGKAKLLAEHEQLLKQHLSKKPDSTLAELREAIGLSCTLPTIHNALKRMGLSYKKRRFELASRSAKTLRKPASAGESINQS